MIPCSSSPLHTHAQVASFGYSGIIISFVRSSVRAFSERERPQDEDFFTYPLATA